MEEQRYDVVVWGGGLGGTCAALQAARSGVRVALLLSGSWCGGMLTAAGVSAPDGHELSAWHTGLWGTFLRAMAHREPGGLDHNWVSCFGFRPDRAEALLQGWLAAEDRLRVLPQAQLQHLRRSGGRIRWLEVSCGEASVRLHGTLFIDGSDLGDLVAAAAVPFRLGWEDRSCWQEPSAPTAAQLRDDPFFRQQPVQSPTWVAMATVSAGDLKATPPLAHPFQHATSGYGLERLLRYGQLPDGLCMLNWPQDGNDYHRNLLRAFGSAAEQRALAEEMRQHSLQFLDAVVAAADGAVAPAALFPAPTATPGCLALAPYWREGRRMEGVATLSENDVLPEPAGYGAIPRCADGTCQTVAIGNYPNDHHYPHRPPGPWPLAPKQHLWGGRLSGTPFAVPWGMLLSADCPNLLAADKAVSVSHVANGTTRLQPMVMNLGQVAGLAAALAASRRCDPPGPARCRTPGGPAHGSRCACRAAAQPRPGLARGRLAAAATPRPAGPALRLLSSPCDPAAATTTLAQPPQPAAPRHRAWRRPALVAPQRPQPRAAHHPRTPRCSLLRPLGGRPAGGAPGRPQPPRPLVPGGAGAGLSPITTAMRSGTAPLRAAAAPAPGPPAGA